jgi:hypothetical protein
MLRTAVPKLECPRHRPAGVCQRYNASPRRARPVGCLSTDGSRHSTPQRSALSFARPGRGRVMCSRHYERHHHRPIAARAEALLEDVSHCRSVAASSASDEPLPEGSSVETPAGEKDRREIRFLRPPIDRRWKSRWHLAEPTSALRARTAGRAGAEQGPSRNPAGRHAGGTQAATQGQARWRCCVRQISWLGYAVRPSERDSELAID